jgi:hypothetical protein
MDALTRKDTSPSPGVAVRTCGECGSHSLAKLTIASRVMYEVTRRVHELASGRVGVVWRGDCEVLLARGKLHRLRCGRDRCC